ncbi:30S ribosomal protein S1 [Candidatus Daviesbacteria bacterium]|nr:30S ribosomal protein S1 [Candidatus Daviesbacteria bacterium]
MADLLAQSSTIPVVLHRGAQVEGTVVVITPQEVVFDLGAKAEGAVNKKDFSEDQLKTLKIGDVLPVFVVIPENESGQVILSLQKHFASGRKGDVDKKWQRFFNLMQRKNQIQGQVIEANKGGLVVEVEGVRGFLPGSQVGLEQLSGSEGLSGLIGGQIPVNVIEVDPNNNRLILSARKKVSDDVKKKLAGFKAGEKVTGKVAAIAPFGLIVDLGQTEGVVFTQEVSWSSSAEATEDKELSDQFEMGQEVEAQVLGVDEDLGRVNLSFKRLSADPFEDLVKNYQVDDVVSGIVLETTQNGVAVKLGEGIEGFVPASKIEQGTKYEVGQKTSFLVDEIDKAKRRINLAPFLTTTKGLIYK